MLIGELYGVAVEDVCIPYLGVVVRDSEGIEWNEYVGHDATTTIYRAATRRCELHAIVEVYGVCREELAVMLSVGDVFMDVVHEYPDLTVHLTLFNATIAEGVPQKLEHNDIKWITPNEIPNYEFCPADEEILAKICEVYK